MYVVCMYMSKVGMKPWHLEGKLPKEVHVKSEPEAEVHISPIQVTTIKQDPEAELILHKAKEVHVKSEPEAEVHISPIQATTIKQDPEAELILHKAKEVHVKSEPEADF